MWPFLQFGFHSLAVVYCSLADRQSFIRITTAGFWKTSPSFKWLCAVCCPELLWSAWKGPPPVYSLLISVLLTHSSVPFQTFACVPPNAAQHAEHRLPPAFLDFRPLMLTIAALCRLRNESWLWSLSLIERHPSVRWIQIHDSKQAQSQIMTPSHVTKSCCFTFHRDWVSLWNSFVPCMGSLLQYTYFIHTGLLWLLLLGLKGFNFYSLIRLRSLFFFPIFASLRPDPEYCSHLTPISALPASDTIHCVNCLEIRTNANLKKNKKKILLSKTSIQELLTNIFQSE